MRTMTLSPTSRFGALLGTGRTAGATTRNTCATEVLIDANLDRIRPCSPSSGTVLMRVIGILWKSIGRRCKVPVSTFGRTSRRRDASSEPQASLSARASALGSVASLSALTSPAGSPAVVLGRGTARMRHQLRPVLRRRQPQFQGNERSCAPTLRHHRNLLQHCI